MRLRILFTLQSDISTETKTQSKMSIRFSFIVSLGLTIFSCNKQRDANATGEISGAYAREYSFKVVNQETGSEIGMRTIRDTIFIRPIGSEYEVSNKKWRLNDYDKEGWQNMEHSDDRPKSTYISTYNFLNKSLEMENQPPLHFERNDQVIFWTLAFKYKKVVD